MKKIHFTLLTVLSSMFFSAGAIAQNQPLACISDARAGLSWENGRWKASRFVSTKFILVQTKDGLTKESVAKALSASANFLQCRTAMGGIICHDPLGSVLLYNTQHLKGGIAQLWGATMPSDERDTPTVTAFSCTPF